VEAHPQDAHEEVDGVAGKVSFRPAPVAVFEDEAGVGGQFIVARFALDECQAAPLQEGNQRGQAGVADLFTGPARAGGVACVTRGVGHSLFSSGVG